ITYWYDVGTSSVIILNGGIYHFYTNPNDDHPAFHERVWALGDSGTGDSNASAVRDAYINFTGTTATNLIMLLGNNSQPSGSDSNYQTDLFSEYPTILRTSTMIPTLGEADTNGSTNPPLTIPYFSVFTVPTGTDGGGVASGTEKYFS